MVDRADELRVTLLSMVRAGADVVGLTRAAVKDFVVGGLKDAGEIAANTAIFAGTVKSAVIGIADAGRGTVEGVRGAAGGIIQAAADVGADLTQASAATIRGILDAARELGQDGGGLVRAGAEGMLEAAGELGYEAVVTVRRGLLEAAAVPREVIDAAIGAEQPGETIDPDEPPAGTDDPESRGSDYRYR